MSTKLTMASVAALLVAAPALAADLNGIGSGCCADLEERVAELEATAARKGNRKMSLTVYGSVNKAIMWTDGLDQFGLGGGPLGIEDKTRVIDNSNAQSRVGFRGEAKINPKMTAGYVLEVGVSENSTGLLFDELTIRHSAVYLDTEAGRFTLGQTSQATDGIVEISVANTAVASTMLSLEPFSGVYLGWLNPNNLPFDGGRKQIARYDTPTFGGFKGSAAWASEDEWDAALRYAGELGQFRLAAGVGYRNLDSATGGSETISGSASIMHAPSGIFANGAYAQFDGDLSGSAFGIPIGNVATDLDLKGAHVQAGIEKNLFGPGATTVFGEWSQLEIGGASGTPQMWGGGIVQSIDAAAVDLYVSYRSYDLDVTGVDNVQVGTAGMRVQF